MRPSEAAALPDDVRTVLPALLPDPGSARVTGRLAYPLQEAATLEDVRAFLPTLLADLHIEALLHGNVTRQARPCCS